MKKLWPGTPTHHPFPELNINRLMQFACEKLQLDSADIEVFDVQLDGMYGEHQDCKIAIDTEFAKSHLPHNLAGLQFSCVLLHELVHVAQLQQGRAKGPVGFNPRPSPAGKYGYWIHWWEGSDQIFALQRGDTQDSTYSHLPWEIEANVNSLHLYHQAFDSGLIPESFGRGAEIDPHYSKQELSLVKLLVS